MLLNKFSYNLIQDKKFKKKILLINKPRLFLKNRKGNKREVKKKSEKEENQTFLMKEMKRFRMSLSNLLLKSYKKKK